MRYCVDYKSSFKYLKEIDELNITFRRKDTSLPEFINRYQDKRINIFIENEQDFIENNSIKIFDALVEQYPKTEIVLVLKNYNDKLCKQIYFIIKNNKIKHKFFFKDFIDNWDVLNGYADLQPTDIYIVNDLGFSIKKVGIFLHNKGIRVRVFPNVAQSKWSGKKDSLKTFFIRPEDVLFYEPYVDTLEFFGRPNSVETYYKIYNIDRQWFGQLKEMILSLDSEIDSRYLIPSFAQYRLNCGKRCNQGSHCDICKSYAEMADVLKKAHISSKDIIDNLINEEDEEDNDDD